MPGKSIDDFVLQLSNLDDIMKERKVVKKFL